MRRIVLIAAAAMSLASVAQSQDAKMNAFVDNLMSQMTIEEKIGQLNLLPAPTEIVTGTKQTDDFVGKIRKGEVGGVLNCKGVKNVRELQRLNIENHRLHIPMIIGMDVIHGFETIFPIPLAQSCSWDTTAVKAGARINAIEATADGQMWTYSPMVDIARDPRWGRMAEGNGEDPFLGSAMAKALVEGYQGTDLTDKTTMMACVKHFALYGAGEGGRDYNTVDMSRVSMYNYFLPPYKAAIEAGAGSVMSSFNVVDAIPATANKWLLTTLLRDEWKFNGFVVTDYASIYEMTAHGIGDLKTSGALALKAGTDFDMGAESFIRHLKEALNEGLVSEEDINKACRRMLEAKWKLGLFDDPYRYCDLNRFKKDVYNEKHLAAARDMAAETFVLLKNSNNVLPLAKKGTIALVGPMADNRTNMAGMWSVAAVHERHETLKESMTKALKGTGATLLYAKGCNFMHDASQEAIICRNGHAVRDSRSEEEMLYEAMEIARKADVIVFAGGEASESSGEGSSRAFLETYDAQHDLLVELKKLGKPIVMLNFSGRSTILNWENANLDALLNVWFGGSKAGDAICDVIFGDKVPCGHLTTSFPKSEGQIPLYYNHLNTGRPTKKWFQPYTSNYMDIDNEPLYPFGYGLSYTTFEYGDIVLDKSTMTEDGTIKASVKVTNTGNYDGAEVVQLYIRDIFASISRPVKELKGFKRINLKKGESQVVEFEITADLLKFYNSDLNFVCEPGDFELMIGPNSRDTKSVNFTLK